MVTTWVKEGKVWQGYLFPEVAREKGGEVKVRVGARKPTLTRVVHCKKEPYDVYVGRPSVWGNPFRVGREGGREEVIRKYEQWLRTRPELVERVKRELRGKVLGCWCAPLACHGDVLARIANEEVGHVCGG